MTDFNATCYLRELQAMNRENTMLTPKNSAYDTIWDCAFDHAIRALLTKQGLTGGQTAAFIRNPNGSYSLQITKKEETP